jgi:hypothetical protein
VPEDDTRSNEVLVLFRVGGSVGLLIKLPRGSVLLFLSCQNEFKKKGDARQFDLPTN